MSDKCPAFKWVMEGQKLIANTLGKPMSEGPKLIAVTLGKGQGAHKNKVAADQKQADEVACIKNKSPRNKLASKPKALVRMWP